MNRVIKFRAWDIHKKVFIPKEVYAVIDTDFNAFGVMLKDWENYKEGEYFYSNSQILMQFTGLLDKNVKEIYEGDIVQVSTMVNVSELLFEPHEYVAQEIYCEVVYSEEIASFDLKTLQRDTHLAAWGFYGQDANDDIEVISNIYENPDLLTRLASDAATI